MSADIVDWLLGEAHRIGPTLALLTELGERLNVGGVDVRRITTGIPILHPQVASYSALWNRGGDATERVYHFEQATMDARIGGMCATLGRTALMSEEFAGALGDDAESVGTFELKGVARPQPVFAPKGTGR